MLAIIGGFEMALYTLAELETEITTWKAALSSLNHQAVVKIGDNEIHARDIDKVRSHLQWLDQQRDSALACSTPAPAVGRTYARTGRNR